eukprot:m.29751 g.29751  ORF g.29751 m.29751 type:complete len:520 (+) comp9597_c1_seq1:82-1641(+)
MSHFENPTTVLYKIHNVFKESDETGSCRAVLRGTMRGSSTGISDDFKSSVDSRDLSPTAPKAYADRMEYPIAEEGDVVYNETEEEEVEDTTTQVDEEAEDGQINVAMSSFLGSSDMNGTVSIGARPIRMLRKRLPPKRIKDEFLSPITVALNNEVVSTNKYASDYARFSGEGQNPRKIKEFKMWFPFLGEDVLPIDIKALNSCTVLQLIGFTLYKFNADPHRNDQINEDVELFELRLNESDGEPDMELPALSEDHFIYNLGFESLCVCKKKNVQQKTAKTPAKGYFYVYYPDGSSTLLKRDTNHTIGEILKLALRRRDIRFGQHDVEVKGQEGTFLDLKDTLLDIESRYGTRVELAIIKRFARREDEEEEDDTPECDMLRAIDHILSMNHTQAYYVSRVKGRYSHHAVELRVSSESISITSFSARSSILHKSKKVEIPIDHIVLCERNASERYARHFNVIFWAHGDWKEQVLEAKTREEAEKIVRNINGILMFKNSRKNNEIKIRFSATKAKQDSHGNI